MAQTVLGKSNIQSILLRKNLLRMSIELLFFKRATDSCYQSTFHLGLKDNERRQWWVDWYSSVPLKEDVWDFVIKEKKYVVGNH